MRRGVWLCGLLLLALVGGGYWAFEKYQERRTVDTVQPFIRQASIRVNDAVLIQSEPGGISFAEVFEKLEKNLDAIDRILLDLQGLDIRSAVEVQTAAIRYVRSGQVLMRSIDLEARKLMALNIANTRLDSRRASVSTASASGLTDARIDEQMAVEKVGKASDEYLQYRGTMCEGAKKFKSERAKIVEVGLVENIIDEGGISEVMNACK